MCRTSSDDGWFRFQAFVQTFCFRHPPSHVLPRPACIGHQCSHRKASVSLQTSGRCMVGESRVRRMHAHRYVDGGFMPAHSWGGRS